MSMQDTDYLNWINQSNQLLKANIWMTIYQILLTHLGRHEWTRFLIRLLKAKVAIWHRSS